MAEATRGAAQDYYTEGGQQQYQPPSGPPPNQQYDQPPPGPPPNRQYYMPGPPPPQAYGGQNSNEKLDFANTFQVQRPKYNDIWAGLLFLAVFAGFVAVSGISLQGYAANKGFNGNGIYDGQKAPALNTSTVILFAFVLGVATVLSYAYVWLARIFPKAFIWITGILNIVFGFVLAIWMLVRHSYAGGIIFLIFAAFTLFCFFTWIPRIPFSAFMLRTSIDISKSYGHTYLVSLIGGLVGVAFAAWYSITLVAIYARFQPTSPACANSGGCGTATITGLIVFVTFAAYWISEVIKNVVHATIAGVYGSWFFCSNNMPRGATRGAFKRTMTYSFGSISLGSLIVALINFFRQLCSVAQSNAAGDGNIVGAIMFCILQCFISILDWLVEFINRYAFVSIALYGSSYFQAAKDTWTLMKNRGIDILVNLCLISPVLSMGGFFVGFTTGLLSYLYLIFTHPPYNTDGSFTAVIIFFSFIIGFQLCNIFTTPLGSGIDALFVASAWDPEVLRANHPEMYGEMLKVYPPLGQAMSV